MCLLASNQYLKRDVSGLTFRADCEMKPQSALFIPSRLPDVKGGLAARFAVILRTVNRKIKIK